MAEPRLFFCAVLQVKFIFSFFEGLKVKMTKGKRRVPDLIFFLPLLSSNVVTPWFFFVFLSSVLAVKRVNNV